jgi:short-subunit dehydrogenase
MRPHGRDALVTGGSSGIGAAIATALTGVGARVRILGRDAARLDAVARHSGAEPVVADLVTDAGLATATAAAAEADLVVNAAGRGWAGDVGEMPPADLAALVTLDLVVPMQLARAAVPGMRRRGGGHLVFVSSIAAVGVGGEAAYSAGKAGLRAFAAALRHDVAGDGIGVTTVFPGAVDTPFFDRRGRRYDRRFPRMVPPDAVARRVLRALERDRAEVFVPAWLSLAARVQGVAPGVFHRMAGRFG